MSSTPMHPAQESRIRPARQKSTSLDSPAAGSSCSALLCKTTPRKQQGAALGQGTAYSDRPWDRAAWGQQLGAEDHGGWGGEIGALSPLV